MTQSYIDQIARAIYDAEMRVHLPDGDYGEPLEWQWPLYRIYAVLMLAKGTETTAEDVHDAWAAWVMEINSNHRSLVPFGDLSADVQELDMPYVRAIHKVAREGVPV